MAKKVTIHTEYITLGQLLKKTDWIQTGGEAKIMVKQLKITVNNEPEDRRGRKIYAGDTITIESETYNILHADS
ncbi:MAG: S4 domain-containing protein YaaA [Erysipelotrichales bacterium]|nr:S4 domain-containing protein YaaA [Erysipelotrichales bacterium]